MNDIYQKEPYTKIPNELLEHLAKVALCDYENRIVFAIIIKTFGFQNVPKKIWKYDFISLSQIMGITGIKKKQYVSKYLIRLKKRKIVVGIPGRKIGINTEYSEWIMSYKDMTFSCNTNILQKSSDDNTEVIQIDDKSNIDRGLQNNKGIQNEEEILNKQKAEAVRKFLNDKYIKKKTEVEPLSEILKNIL